MTCLWMWVSLQTSQRQILNALKISFNIISRATYTERSYPYTYYLSLSEISVNLISIICFCSTKLDLRFSLALCDKEKQFRQRRKERVMLGIKKLLDMEKPRFLPSSPEEVGLP